MEPVRIFIPERIVVGSSSINGSSHAWLLEKDEQRSVIEFNNKRYAIPNDSYCSSPVPAPDGDVLERLDSCFLKPMDHFEAIVSSKENYYRILKCREHGKFFLEDYRGGIAMYHRLIFLGESLDGTPSQIWKRFHAVSDDELNYLRIAK